jgi:hypothetical protein
VTPTGCEAYLINSSTSVVAACTHQPWLPRRLVDDNSFGQKTTDRDARSHKGRNLFSASFRPTECLDASTII